MNGKKRKHNKHTLPKTNIAPEDRPSQKETSRLTVSCRECKFKKKTSPEWLVLVQLCPWKTRQLDQTQSLPIRCKQMQRDLFALLAMLLVDHPTWWSVDVGDKHLQNVVSWLVWGFGIMKSLSQIILNPQTVWRGRNTKSWDQHGKQLPAKLCFSNIAPGIRKWNLKRTLGKGKNIDPKHKKWVPSWFWGVQHTLKPADCFWIEFPGGILKVYVGIPKEKQRFIHGWSTYPPPKRTPLQKGLIAVLMKGNPLVLSPDHKACYFWGGEVRGPGGVGWLTIIELELQMASQLTRPTGRYYLPEILRAY